MEEHEMFMDKLKARFESIMERLAKANAAIDLNVILMGEITERTENYREYFFSRKMIDDAQRKFSEKAMNDVNEFQVQMTEFNPTNIDEALDPMFAAMEATIKQVEELVETAAKEVERLDK